MSELASDPSRPPAARLPGELIDLLGRERRRLADIDVFAVATGPGSFTGLRIGIATMQGLAMAEGKPLIGVSGFDALLDAARQHTGQAFTASQPLIATWVDAWRGEVYAALYQDGRQIEPPTVAHPTALLERMAGTPTVFIGDGAATYADTIRAARGDNAAVADPATPLLAGHIARLATAAAQAGDRPAPHAIRPLYVRRPDAELAKHALLDRHARK